MNNSNLEDDVKKTLEDVIKKGINDGKINLTTDFIDASDTESVEPISNNNIESKVDKEAGSMQVNSSENNSISSDSQSKDEKQKNNGNFLDEAKGLANDARNSSGKNNVLNKGSNLENKNNLNKASDKVKNAASNLKKDLQPVTDTAKQAANQLKEQGKNAAAKAGGAAITAATGGVIPPKLGEWASKKALDKLEKDTNKKLQKVKESASKVKEKIDNNENLQKAKSKVTETATNTIKAVKFIKTIKTIGPIILGVVGVVSVIGLIVGLGAIIQTYLPGAIGDVKKEVEVENYSSRDRKILNKMEKINKKYPNADASIVMSTVSYPYYELLQSDMVNTSDSEGNESEDNTKEESFYNNVEKNFEDDSGNVDEVDEETENENDMYLNIYSKKKYRDKYEDLMKVYNSEGKEGFEKYLNETYFEEDSGYKKLLKSVKSNETEDTKNLIIDEIYDNSILFDRYVSLNKNCYTSYVSVDNVKVEEILKGNILVDVKEESCTTTDISSCESWYSSPISLSEYIKGVTWTEMSINSNTDIEKIKAQMVAAKSYVLGRYKSMGWEKDVYQNESGSYVIPIRSNTYDQDYCDYKEGCYNKLSGNKHKAATADEQIILDIAWQDIADIYIVNKSDSVPKGSYCASREKTDYYDCSWCELGSCLSQTELTQYTSVTYKDILSEQYSSYAIVEIEGTEATMQVASSSICTSNTPNLSATRNKIIAFANSYIGKIPYYENGLATMSGFEGNNFGSDTIDDGNGNTKKGLNSVGFVNWVYWSVIGDNLGNSNNVDDILSLGYEIQQDMLLLGDIGYSQDKTVVGIYAGDNKWIIEDKISGNVVLKPDDRITMYMRHNYFKTETYNFSIRETIPTAEQWGGNNMFVMPSTPSLMGECPWYAKNRAAEIIDELYRNGSLTNQQYNAYYKRVRTTRGNGADFYPGGAADNGYQGSINVTDLKAGSFIGLKSVNTPAGIKYGHVVVVEYVGEDKIIITDGWRKKEPQTFCKNYSDFSCVKYRKKEFSSYEEFYDWVDGTKGYTFQGYLYFLED